MCFWAVAFWVFQDTSVVIHECRTQGMQRQVNVSILQPLGFMIVIGDLKHVMLSIFLLLSALPSSTLFHSDQIPGRSQILEEKFVLKQENQRSHDTAVPQRQISSTLSCSTDTFSWFPTDIWYVADSNFSMQKPNRSAMLQLGILKVFKCWYEVLSTNLLEK